MGVFPSGQWGQTVNLLHFCFGGSNPPAPTNKKPCRIKILQGFLLSGLRFGPHFRWNPSWCQIAPQNLINFICNTGVVIGEFVRVYAVRVHAGGLTAQSAQITLTKVLRQGNEGVAHFIAADGCNAV